MTREEKRELCGWMSHLTVVDTKPHSGLSIPLVVRALPLELFHAHLVEARLFVVLESAKIDEVLALRSASQRRERGVSFSSETRVKDTRMQTHRVSSVGRMARERWEAPHSLGAVELSHRRQVLIQRLGTGRKKVGWRVSNDKCCDGAANFFHLAPHGATLHECVNFHRQPLYTVDDAVGRNWQGPRVEKNRASAFWYLLHSARKGRIVPDAPGRLFLGISTHVLPHLSRRNRTVGEEKLYAVERNMWCPCLAVIARLALSGNAGSKMVHVQPRDLAPCVSRPKEGEAVYLDTAARLPFYLINVPVEEPVPGPLLVEGRLGVGPLFLGLHGDTHLA